MTKQPNLQRGDTFTVGAYWYKVTSTKYDESNKLWWIKAKRWAPSAQKWGGSTSYIYKPEMHKFTGIDLVEVR